MLNLGSSFVTILGIALALAGVGLYFLRSIRPELARDHDIFFAAISLVCGLILLFQGWRLDPILAFSQYLLAGSAVFFAFENIRLRGVTTEQAKRNTPIVDDERPVSSVYRYQDAELEELEPVDDWPSNRRIPASRESRSSRNGTYDSESRRRPSSRSSSSERFVQRDQPRKSRPRPEAPSPDLTDEWGDVRMTEERERPVRPSRNRPPISEDRQTDRQTDRQIDQEEAVSPRSRRRRPPEDSDSRRYREETEANSTEYVDYQPIDNPDEEDNSGYQPKL